MVHLVPLKISRGEVVILRRLNLKSCVCKELIDLCALVSFLRSNAEKWYRTPWDKLTSKRTPLMTRDACSTREPCMGYCVSAPGQ